MSKRVSLKGKGADIFFGDYTPAPPEAAPEPTPDQTASETHQPEVDGSSVAQLDTHLAHSAGDVADQPRQASLQAGKRARKQEPPRRVEAPQESVTEDGVDSFPATVLATLWKDVNEPATITNSFRYTEQELSSLTDVLYEIGKRHGAKLSKQDIARLGLNFVLRDYQVRGEASLLGQLALRRRRPRRG